MFYLTSQFNCLLMLLRKVENTIQFTLLVKTRAPRNEIIINDDHVMIKIKATPVKGKANRMIIKFISAKWGVSTSNISIISGLTSSIKTISISNTDIESLNNVIKT